MQNLKSMEHAIQHVSEEIRKIRNILDDIQRDVEQVDPPRTGGSRLLRTTERLKEAHLRLEGIEQFVLECGSRAAHDTSADTEEIDVWL